MSGKKRSRIGLALAGGGLLAAVYEIGALAALSEALDGVDFNELDIYVGTSAGGFVAAGLANGLRPHEMVRVFIESESADNPLAHPARLLRPALDEYRTRASLVPALLASSVRDFLVRPEDRSFCGVLLRLSQVLPAGLFTGVDLERYLRKWYSAPGRTNDFRKLRRKLVLVAADVESGAAVEFGTAGFQDVPISAALRASAALPGLFPPVKIKGRCYVDGALNNTLHASVALKDGVGLLLCINPLVPYTDRHYSARPPIVRAGLPAILAQTVRAVMHSRVQAHMASYAAEFPDSDVVLFEPHRDDTEIFRSRLFALAGRRQLCEHAYRTTRAELFARRHMLEPMLLRHGVRLDLAVLKDRGLGLLGTPTRRPAVARLDDALDDLERWLRIARLGGTQA